MVKNLSLNVSKFFIDNERAFQMKFKQKGIAPIIDFTGRKVLRDIERIAGLVPEDLNPMFYYLSLEFSKYLDLVLKDMNNQEISNYFHYVNSICGVYYSNSPRETATFDFIAENNNLSGLIFLSPYDSTNNYAVELIHELSHFYDYYNAHYGKTVEPHELTEVLPIFFEYMMYLKTSPNGYEDFVRNKTFDVFAFGSLKEFFRIPNLSPEDRERSKYLLTKEIQYICGFNYVLQLIERRKQDKRLVDSEIAHVLYGRKNSVAMAQKLDINYAKFKPLEKTLRKRMYQKWNT